MDTRQCVYSLVPSSYWFVATRITLRAGAETGKQKPRTRRGFLVQSPGHVLVAEAPEIR